MNYCYSQASPSGNDDASPDGNDKSSQKTIVVIVSVVGAIAVCIAVAVLVYYLYFKVQSNDLSEPLTPATPINSN